jgi:hypothetical protein
MQPSKATPTRSAHLATNLDKTLLGYATAASAAGVGLLALVQPAEAKIIYTPTNTPITLNGPVVALDLNNDGVTDFYLYNVADSGSARKHPEGFYQHAIAVEPTQTVNQVGVITSFNKDVCAAELPKGQVIGVGKNFQVGSFAMFQVTNESYTIGTANCQWQGKANKGGFLALTFVVGSNTYFGWARITLGTVPTLTGYAYEDAPNQSIKAGQISGPGEKSDASQAPALDPQPATLGALAKGASGLAIWRRPEDMN